MSVGVCGLLHERAHALIRRYRCPRVLWPSHPVRLAGDVQDQGLGRVEDISAGTRFVSGGWGCGEEQRHEERPLFVAGRGARAWVRVSWYGQGEGGAWKGAEGGELRGW